MLDQINQICDKARGLSHAMDEVVWAVNSRRDTLRDFVSYVCKHAQQYLQATTIRCRLDVEPELPAVALALPVRRNLFLAVKEALNNAAKHSRAGELFLRIHRRQQKLAVVVEDNGKGFDPATADLLRNGITNMQERMNEIGGTCQVLSGLGSGCWVEFLVPLNFKRPPRWRPWSRTRMPEDPEALKNSYPGAESGPAR
jgi:signal transduction histidine kinase